jgi:2-polyprenyl-3-methyl-5-hydroxy-6-metoxy-1,4-benzoquinol methylase
MFETDALDRGLFERPAHSFEFDDRALQWISDDEANPLNRIAQLIPVGKSVLDVGAGNGVLARLLAFQGRNCVIDGVEPDTVAQQAARSYYRNLFCGTVDEFVSVRRESECLQYDFIVMADVLEHIANPMPTLLQLKQLLTPNGKLIISTPNVAFASVRLALMNGQFDYVDSGILERTHLRFYTNKSLRILFEAVGLHPHTQFNCLRDPRHTEIRVESFPLSSLILRLLEADELAAIYQFLFVLGVDKPERFTQANLGSRKTKRPSLIRRLLRIARDLMGPRSIAT